MPNIHLLDFSGPQLELLVPPVLRCVGCCRDIAGYTIAPHSHPVTELLFVAEGDGTARVEDVNHPLCPGDLVIYNPGTLHSECFSRQSAVPLFYHLKFDEYLISGLPAATLLPPGHSPVFPAGDAAWAIQTQMSLLFTESQTRYPGCQQITQNLLENILLFTLRTLSRNNAAISTRESGSVLSKIQQYFQENCDKSLSMKEVADRFHVNYFYLSHLFKKSLGMSPSEYLICCRINKACRILSTTDLPVYRIAELCGYASQSAFQAQFRRLKSMSPLQYRSCYDATRAVVNGNFLLT